jgi:hypothetical protein
MHSKSLWAPGGKARLRGQLRQQLRRQLRWQLRWHLHRGRPLAELRGRRLARRGRVHVLRGRRAGRAPASSCSRRPGLPLRSKGHGQAVPASAAPARADTGLVDGCPLVRALLTPLTRGGGCQHARSGRQLPGRVGMPRLLCVARVSQAGLVRWHRTA